MENIKNVVHTEECLEKLRILAFGASRAELHNLWRSIAYAT